MVLSLVLRLLLFVVLLVVCCEGILTVDPCLNEDPFKEFAFQLALGEIVILSFPPDDMVSLSKRREKIDC